MEEADTDGEDLAHSGGEDCGGGAVVVDDLVEEDDGGVSVWVESRR